MLKTIVLLMSLLLIGCGNYDNVNAPFDAVDQGDGETGDEEPLENAELSFEVMQREIFQPQCIGCHSGYSDYSTVKASANKILERMTTSDPVRRMPKGGPPLDPELIEMFTEWVNQGAPEFSEAELIEELDFLKNEI